MSQHRIHERLLCAQVPSACFVQPPLAYVGFTEEEAIEKVSGNIDVFVSKFKPMKNTISGRDERTFMKLLVHSETDQVWAGILCLTQVWSHMVCRIRTCLMN